MSDLLVNLIMAAATYAVVALAGAPTWADVMAAALSFQIQVALDYAHGAAR